jgi:diguanylate cyclase (GGDEF)-like protein
MCPWHAGFAPALEARFQRDQAAHRLHLLRRASRLGALFAMGMVVTDWFLLPDMFWQVLLFKGVLFPLVCVFGQMAVERWAPVAWREWSLAGGGALGVLICLGISLSSQSVWALESLVVLDIVVMFVTAVARFLPALALSALALVGHLLAIHTMQLTPHPVAQSSTILLISLLAFTLYAAWVLERDERRAWLMARQEEALQHELRQAHDTMAQTARTDNLTQLANRRHFDEVLGQVWADSVARRQSLAVLLVDVDHFKAFNDLYGHPAGDACLRAVAAAMLQCVRKGGDVMARWGGEEFAVVMNDASLDSARLLAERIRAAVHEMARPHAASRSGSVVSVSVGVSAMVPDSHSSLDELLRTADLCLYEAKSRGRNRVWARDADPYVSDHEVNAA